MKAYLLHAYLLFAALIALCSCDHGRQHIDVDRAAYPVKGIDVSSHNGIIDFEAAKADSIEFVFIKATEGSDFCDSFFARNFDAARDAGLKVGAYHFFRFDTPGHQQAYHFLSTINGREPDLPLVIDVEDWTNSDSIPSQDVVAALEQMLSVLQNSGHQVMVYTNRKGYESYIEGNFGDLPVWICSFAGAPDFAPAWQVWQHSHKGRVAGLRGDVDINAFNGSHEQFLDWATPEATVEMHADHQDDASEADYADYGLW